MDLNKGLVFTSEDCIGCNKCIKGCPVIGSNLAIEENGAARIIVDGNKCIHCGQCLRNCGHEARHFKDDINELELALSNGETIDLLIAPSFFLIYKDIANQLIGYLKTKGFSHVYDVSAGANITTWAYASYLKETGKRGMISSACPVIVDYIKKYKPELKKYLMPVMSPVSCLREYLEKRRPSPGRKFAFLCPCIGKHDELSTADGGRPMDYTFTFKSLFNLLSDRNIRTDNFYGCCDDIMDPALGQFYPVPGGLKNNLRLFMDVNEYIKQIEGPDSVYNYLSYYAEAVKTPGEDLPFFIDILNCKGGCTEGVASTTGLNYYDKYAMELISSLKSKDVMIPGTAFDSSLDTWQRMAKFTKQMSKEGFSPSDFYRTFAEKESPDSDDISPVVIESTFRKLKKLTPESRAINCTSCGYSSCRNMAIAIARGYNHPENCIHYMRDTLEKEQNDLSALLSSIYKEGDVTNPSKMGSDYIIQSLSSAINEIESTREQVLNESQDKSRFFASMTHELRTPLNAILNMAQTYKNSLPENANCAEIDSIITAGEELLDTINELLDMSKLDSGKFSIIESEYFFSPFINDICNIIRFRAMEKKLTFDVLLEPTLPQSLIGDSKRVRQILINLLSNSIKYTKKGVVTLKVSWNHDETNPVLTFEVRDTGIGIKDEDIPFLFSAYKQVDEARNHNIEGTGLGLSIVKALSDEMGGTVSVSSEYGLGSVFTLVLPQKINKYKPLSEKNSSEKGSCAEVVSAPRANILIVDDMSVNQKIASSFLDDLQVGVFLASSGEEALEMCSKTVFDFILMDYQMPGMDGLETLRNLRESECISKNAKAYILSAEDDFKTDSADLFSGFLGKPLIKDAFRHSVISSLPEDKVEPVADDALTEHGLTTELARNKDYDRLLSEVCAVERIAKSLNETVLAHEAKYIRLQIQARTYDYISESALENYERLLDEVR